MRLNGYGTRNELNQEPLNLFLYTPSMEEK